MDFQSSFSQIRRKCAVIGGDSFVFRCVAWFRAAKLRYRIWLGLASTYWTWSHPYWPRLYWVKFDKSPAGKFRGWHTTKAHGARRFDLPVAFTKSDFRRRRNFLHAPLAQRTPSRNTLKCSGRPFCSVFEPLPFTSRKRVIYYAFV